MHWDDGNERQGCILSTSSDCTRGHDLTVMIRELGSNGLEVRWPIRDESSRTVGGYLCLLPGLLEVSQVHNEVVEVLRFCCLVSRVSWMDP